MSRPSGSRPRDSVRVAAVSAAGGALLTSLMATTRVQILGQENYDRTWGRRTPAVVVLWHGRLLPCSWIHRHQGLATLISHHRDGDYIARIVQGWGYQTIRGSSSRGGASALRELLRVLRRGGGVAVTPDGPRGPRQRMKLGPLTLAQAAGVPLVPVTAGADRAWWFGGWDRFLVPKPMARLRMAYGEPMEVPRSATPEELERCAAELEARLNALTELVDEPQ